ncbi:MAG: hypothetical protein M0Z52_09100 [Actinomycetota bacterium]|nr:hypothetical protein [Actinomycetota bacterium]
MKKIAVIVRDRTEQALRMALGLTLMDDRVDIYMAYGGPEKTEINTMNLEMLKAMKTGLYSLKQVNGFKNIGFSDFAKAILEYDEIIPY